MAGIWRAAVAHCRSASLVLRRGRPSVRISMSHGQRTHDYCYGDCRTRYLPYPG